jgi:hypothetical protein
MPCRGAKSNASAGANDDLVPVDIEWNRDGMVDATGQADSRFSLIVPENLQDREFIAAKSGDQICFPQTFLQSLPYGFEQGITNRMAKRIVDGFESIEIEKENGKLQALLR